MTTITAEPTTPAAEEPTAQQQTGMLLGQLAGYMAVRTVETGLGSGLLRTIAAMPAATPDELANALDLDAFYVSVWCRSAFAAGVLVRSGAGHRLAPHVETLLLNESSPGYVGGMFPLVRQPEMFGRFAESLASGQRIWWNETSPDWISGVAATGRPFYTRLIPAGLDRIDGLAERLHAGCRVVDTACGAGAGLLALAKAYPNCQIVGVDGDQHSIDQAADAVAAAGIGSRVQLVCAPLEEFTLNEPATLVVNNISMHECRDIDHVAIRVKEALEPGGWFVISDFPFPDTDAGLRSVPGRLMCGIQFFEAQIDDQLLPRSAYDALLDRHGFTDLDSFVLSPVHAVTHARKPS